MDKDYKLKSVVCNIGSQKNEYGCYKIKVVAGDKAYYETTIVESNI